MQQPMFDQFVDDFSRNASGNALKRRVKPHSDTLGRRVGHALLACGSHGEAKFAADILHLFKPLEVVNYSVEPRWVRLEGVGPNGLPIVAELQEKVYPVLNTGKKKQPWKLDLTIQMYDRSLDDSPSEIASYCFEYDGHDSHYTSDGVRSAYLRDATVALTRGYTTIRVWPQHWHRHKDEMLDLFWDRLSEIAENDRQRRYREASDAFDFVLDLYPEFGDRAPSYDDWFGDI